MHLLAAVAILAPVVVAAQGRTGNKSKTPIEEVRDEVADLRRQVRELRMTVEELQAEIRVLKGGPAVDPKTMKAAVAAGKIVVGMTRQQVLDSMRKADMGAHRGDVTERRASGGKTVRTDEWLVETMRVEDRASKPSYRVRFEDDVVVQVTEMK